MKNMVNKTLLGAVAIALWGTAGCSGDDGGGMTSAASTISVFMGGTVTGTGTFSEDVVDAPVGSVKLTLTLTNCVDTKVYPAHIHQGSACTDATTQGGHWDMTRGEGIPTITCAGTTGTTSVVRYPTDPALAWSIGGDAATNVIGHVIVIHDPTTPMTRIACGAIAAAP